MSLVGPTVVRVSAPSESHQKGNESAKKQNVTNPVESLELLAKCLLAGGSTGRGLHDDMISGVLKSEEEPTHEVKCCNADDNEALKDELDTEDPSPAVYGVGSRCGTDGEKSNER